MLDRLERRLGGWEIPNLAAFIVGMNALVWAFSLLKPEFPFILTLDPVRALHGEPWRFVTFLFIPPSIGPLWMIFWLMLFYSYASALEAEWGDFRFNAFFGLGAVATIIASVGLGEGLSNVPLNLSLFFAFAKLYPDFELLLFFVLPVKVKWLAWVAWAGVLFGLLGQDFAGRIAWLAGLAGYAAFFGPEHWRDLEYFWRRHVRR